MDLLIARVHRIADRADRRVTEELGNAFKKVTGKVHILFAIAEAAVEAPDAAVRDVVSRPCPAGSRRCGTWCRSMRPSGRSTSGSSSNAEATDRTLPDRRPPAQRKARREYA